MGINYSQEFINLADLVSGDKKYLLLDQELVRRLGLEVCAVWRAVYTAMKHKKRTNSMDEDGFFEYGINDLAYFTGLKKYAQSQAIDKLCEIGLLEKTTKRPKFGQQLRYLRVTGSVEILQKLCEPMTKEAYLELNGLAVCCTTASSQCATNSSEYATNSSLVNSNKQIVNVNSNEELKHRAQAPSGGDKVELFSLAPVPKKQELFSKQYKEFAAVKSFSKKVSSDGSWNIDKFTKTDWMMGFIQCYNAVAPKEYDIPARDAAFNVLVANFNNVIKDVPVEKRCSIFMMLLESNFGSGNFVHEWLTGFTIQQFTNEKNRLKVLERINHLVSLANTLTPDLPSVNRQTRSYF